MPVYFAWIWCCWMAMLLQSEGVDGSFFSPQDVPGPPEKILLSAANESAMRVQFLPPERTKAEGNNGAPVLGYKVEVAKRVNGVQTFTVEANGPVLSGSYKVTFKSAAGTTESTSCIPWNATEVEFEMALEELLNIDGVSVSRSAYDGALSGYVYSIEFDGKYLVSGQQPNVLVGSQTGCQATLPRNRVLTFKGAHVTTGIPGYSPEIWEVLTRDTAGTNVIGGRFDLSLGFEGSWVQSGVTVTVTAGSKTAITSAPMVGRVNRGDMIAIGDDIFYVHASAPFTDTELPLDSYHIRVTQGSQEVKTASDFTPYVAVGEHIKIGDWEFKVTAITATALNIAKIALTGNDNWPGVSNQHVTAHKRKKVTLDANSDVAT
uniref:Fibronectin type-III domain-containing protein n=1 Tax=Globisporangium ultimum (strain ATCC 200006 / CBS 805.95 / DAOM BR144) TaxID=431595 RepID=K3WLI4_GLOUD